MKKTIIMTLIVAMVLSIASVVNAAGSMAAKPTKVKKGDKVTVTVNFGKAMATTDFKLTYNKDELEYVSDTAENRNQESDGTRFVTYSNDTKSVTVTFKAKKAGATAKIGFVANEFTNTDLDVEEVKVSGTKVTIEAEKKKEEKKEEKDDTVAKAPVPQTGMNVAAYAAVAGVVALAVAGVAVVGKKEDK